MQLLQEPLHNQASLKASPYQRAGVCLRELTLQSLHGGKDEEESTTWFGLRHYWSISSRLSKLRSDLTSASAACRAPVKGPGCRSALPALPSPTQVSPRAAAAPGSAWLGVITCKSEKKKLERLPLAENSALFSWRSEQNGLCSLKYKIAQEPNAARNKVAISTSSH